MREARGRLVGVARALGALGVVLALAGVAAADLGALASDDPRAIDAAIAELERGDAPADALFAAARACEDKLFDPARALALYDRIARDHGDAGVAVAAHRRAELLRARVGARGEHAREAGELARLIASAETLAADDVVRRADALADAAWPGAPDAGAWLAGWLRRRGDLAGARARYERVAERWPSSPQADAARRGAAGCALDAAAWDVAEALAERLPTAAPDDRILRDDLLAAIARGRLRARLAIVAWLVLAVVVVALVGSLADAMLRGGRRWPPRRPPIEALFLAPITALVVALAFTAHHAIAPAVLRISVGGLALAWLSGAALDTLRVRGRPLRARAIGHVVACALGVVAIGYLAMTTDGLYDMLAETVRFGPES